MLCREALDMQLINDCFVPGTLELAIAGPIEKRLMNDTAGHERRAILVIPCIGVIEKIGEYSFIPGNVAIDPFCIRIEQQLRGIAAIALLRDPRPTHPKTITLSRLY